MGDGISASWGTEKARWSVLVHGGAGNVLPAALPGSIEGCAVAAREAANVLAGGGSALDAAQRAVEILEDDPRFNAGTGACLNADGEIELDASIMEGTHLRAGGVCALPPFFHPIAIARKLLDEAGHVLLASEGAARFAARHGFARATLAEMITDKARARWEAVRAAGGDTGWAGGTVGAVARDAEGRVASATSTGGRVNKLAGRVGDTPILGAGTYADDEAGAASNTGDGEAVLRLCLAKTAIDSMREGAVPIDAARAAIGRMLARAGGRGGIILVSRDGSLGFARSTRTMTWAAANDRSPEVVKGG